MAVKQTNPDDIGTPASGGTENASKSAASDGNMKTNSSDFVSRPLRIIHETLSKPMRSEPNIEIFQIILNQLSTIEVTNEAIYNEILQIGKLLRYRNFTPNDFHLVCEKVTDFKTNANLSPAVGILFNLFDEALKEDAIRAIVKHDDNEIIKTVTNFCFWAQKSAFCKNLHKYIISILEELRKQNENSDAIIRQIAKKIEMNQLLTAVLIPFLRPTIAPVALYFFEFYGDLREVVDSISADVFKFLMKLYKEKEWFDKFICAFSKLNHKIYADTLNRLSEHSSICLPYDYQTIERNNFYNDKSYLRSSKTHRAGLVNLGNTCYMNSVLQALAMTKEFSREILLCGNTTPLLRNLQELVALMLHSRRPELNPSAVLDVATPSNFTPGFQQDSSEFLGHLLEVLHQQESSTRSPLINVSQHKMLQSFGNKNQDETFNKSSSIEYDMNIDGTNTIINENGASCLNSRISTDSSLNNCNLDLTKSVDLTTTIEKTFTGKLVTTYKCMSCGCQSKIVDAFRDLQLSFPDKKDNCATNYTVQDLINYYCSQELLNGENQYFCANCKKLTDATRFMNVINAPKYLILTLKHFKYDQKFNMRAKLLHKVTPDEGISFKVFSEDCSAEIAVVNYTLYAGVVHSGFSMDSGHYYTYGTDNGNRWYKFNDNIVSVSNINDLRNLTPPNTPYILFYQMRSKNTTNKTINIQLPTTPTLDELPTQLRDYVNKDNSSYRKQKIMSQSQGYRNSGNGHGDQDDDDDPSSNSCNDAYDNRDKCVF